MGKGGGGKFFFFDDAEIATIVEPHQTFYGISDQFWYLNWKFEIIFRSL